MFNPYFFHPKYFWYNPKKKIFEIQGGRYFSILSHVMSLLLTGWKVSTQQKFSSCVKKINLKLLLIHFKSFRKLHSDPDSNFGPSAVWDNKSKLDQNELFEIFVLSHDSILQHKSKWIKISALRQYFETFEEFWYF